MIKLIVHGTKGGYHIFTNNETVGILDARPDFNEGKPIGQTVYALTFNGNEVIFSKYKIIRDVRGDKRTGNIAFSIAIPNTEKLKGRDAKSLLDEIASEYEKHHIENNNLEFAREDWSIYEAIKNKYKTDKKDSVDIDNIKQGEKDAAYIYYSSEEQLQQYFDYPYQPDYADYKQVFFVNQKYKGQPEKPLNALRHSEEADLTGKKILENLSYRVFIPGIKDGISTRVTVNNQNINNHDKIHPRSSIRISFSRRNYHDETIQETLNDLKIKYSNRVVVDDSNRTLTIKPLHKLEPKTKTITFRVENWKGQETRDACISIKSSGYSGAKKDIDSNNRATFEADELTENWSVWVNNKKEGNFIPNNQEGNLKIQIQEEKIVEFKVNAHNFTVSVQRPSSNATVIAGGKKIKFINQAIEQDCSVILKANRYKDKPIRFYPKNTNIINERLEEKKKLQYKIDRNGGTNNGGSDYIEIYEGDSPDYKKIKKDIKPPKGQRFKKLPFKEEKGKGNYDYVLKAQYEKKPAFYKNKRILGIAAAVLVIVVIGYFFKDAIFGSSTDNKPVPQSQYAQITAFAKSDTITSASVNAKIAIVNGKLSSKSSNKQEQEDEGWFSSLFSSSDGNNKNVEDVKDWDSLLKCLNPHCASSPQLLNNL